MLPRPAAILAACGLLACSREEASVAPAHGSASPAPVVAPASAAPSVVAEGAAPPSVASSPRSVADSIPVNPPPKRLVSDDGFLVMELPDGTVRIETTDRWGARVETTYSSCEFYAKAVPVLRRQLSDRRAAQLGKICPRVAR